MIRLRDKDGETLRSIARNHNVSAATDFESYEFGLLCVKIPFMMNLSQETEALAKPLADEAVVPLPVKPSLDHETERAVRVFMRHLEGRYPVREAIVYGSRARQTHSPDSDADIAIILDGERGDRSAAVKDMAGIAFHVMMETGVMVEAMPLWVDELARPETFSNPALIKTILREGIRL